MTFENLDERAMTLANYILDKHTTIRATAKIFNIPKSTVHHDLSVRLKYLDYRTYLEVKKLMDENFSIKHLHGGESTKLKYEALKKNINKNEEIEYLYNV